MSPRIIRMMKEARELFWPWCAVSIVGVLPWLLSGFGSIEHGVAYSLPYRMAYGFYRLSPGIGVIGFLLGVPLLATFSLGNEFQYGTLSLLLTQPVDRMKIWGEKFGVTIIAVLSSALVYYVGVWSVLMGPQHAPFALLYPAVWLVTTTCSAAFCTLALRSTIMGFLTNLMLQFLLLAVSMPRWFGPGNSQDGVWIVVFATLSYAGIMLWLGRRGLSRFQPKTGMAAGDLQMAGSKIGSGSLSGALRSRSTGVVLNLIRKELRLLKPLWLFTIVMVPALICLLGAVAFMNDIRGARLTFEMSAVWLGVYAMLAPILAGSLSMSEEGALRTQSWHMTLPVSVLRQWFIKLLMVTSVGFICTVALPIAVLSVTQFVLGLPLLDRLRPSWITSLQSAPFGMKLSILGFPGVHEAPFFFILVWLLSFAAFWCASAGNSTLKTFLWVFPLVGALIVAGVFGIVFGGSLIDTRTLDFILSKFQPFPFTSAVLSVLRLAAWFWLVGPALMLAMVQSYRLFRMQPRDGVRFVVRYAVPLAVTAFICGSSIGVLGSLVSRPYLQASVVVREVDAAIKSLPRGATREFNTGELIRTFQLSDLTRRWLNGSTITVGAFESKVRFANGLQCTYYQGLWRCLFPDGANWGNGISVPDEFYLQPWNRSDGLNGLYGNVTTIP